VRRARERAGDLAHGLKTPLTILSVEARRLEESGNAASAVRLREQIEQMRAHVERQLVRARSHGATAAGGTLTDASGSLERLLGLMRRMPRSDKLERRNALPGGLRLRIDPEDFGEVVCNLLDNARQWARSRVTVSGVVEGDSVRIAVDDDGPGDSAGAARSPAGPR
jgi:signal transduction histidine kinase